MALPDISTSLSNLNCDCLFQIFPYLQLEDLLNLRYQCSTLNNAVCEYLPRVTSLSVVLSEPHDPHDDIERPKDAARVLKDWFGRRTEEYFRSFFSLRTYGRHNFTVLEDTTMGESQRHFGLENFIVIRNRQRFRMFQEFIEKYKLGKIEKLAVIIDHESYFGDLSELLQLWPDLKVLFLDRTHQCVGENFQRASIDGRDLIELFASIISLSSLNELYFFTRRCSAFNPSNFLQPELRSALEEVFRAFLTILFKKLEIFYINHDSGSCFFSPVFEYSLSPQNYENIKELGIPLSVCLPKGSKAEFRNLRSLTLLGYLSFDFYNRNLFDRLETLKICTLLHFHKETMQFLNSMPSLKRFSVERLSLVSNFGPGKIDDKYVNKTIEHLTIEHKDDHRKKYGDEKEYAYTDFFQSLVTITVTRPEVTVYEKKDMNVLRLSNA